MNKGKLYKECVAPEGQFTYPTHVKATLDEALKDFPSPSTPHYFLDQDILKWLLKWFGIIPPHIEAWFNKAFVEYLKAHLRDGEDGTAY